jgi:uncharacterized protein HemX
LAEAVETFPHVNPVMKSSFIRHFSGIKIRTVVLLIVMVGLTLGLVEQENQISAQKTALRATDTRLRVLQRELEMKEELYENERKVHQAQLELLERKLHQAEDTSVTRVIPL